MAIDVYYKSGLWKESTKKNKWPGFSQALWVKDIPVEEYLIGQFVCYAHNILLCLLA